jgi:serine/threonine protein kinase
MNNKNVIYKYEPLWNEWTVSRFLGSGNNGIVYTITKKNNSNDISVVKLLTIPTNMQNDIISEYYKNNIQEINDFYETAINNILKTLKNLSKLNGHSNIISLENFMVKKDEKDNIWHLFLKMEYATPLIDYLKNNTFTEKDLIRLAMGICNAISSFHNANIIHENIKESNIFISKNNTFKISDFNLIKEFQSTPILDPSVIPPEITEGKPFNKLSDIYSLGILLYKLCNNGNLPFINENKEVTDDDIQESISRRISGSDLPPPKNASKELSRIILKACSYKSENRYKNIDSMKNELKALLQASESKDAKIDSGSIKESNTNKSESKKSNNISKIFGNKRNTINYLPVEENNSYDSKKHKKKLILISSSVLLILIISAFIIININKSESNSENRSNLSTKPTDNVLKTDSNTDNETNLTSSNLLINPNIEEIDEDVWQKNILRIKGKQLITSEKSYEGEKSLQITSNTLESPDNYSEITYFQDVKISKGANYKLSLYIKTEDITENSTSNNGAFAMILFHNEKDELKFSITPYIKSTTDWTYYETSVEIPENSTSETASIHLGISNETGTTYFDSINFEKTD